MANILLSVLLCAVFAGAIGMPRHTVMNILPQSQADAYGLQIGDVIERVGGEDPLFV